ncbi:MAG: lysophospholipid acyltransferase family protein [Verrucomicrobiales bacterium]|jgi:lysophospholipid acyltransferase (LPLAT)-like uncharacterized protein|nr:lysophospholipid acyltransferase family protein [Verrucomicrobiales bacterium]
MKNGPFKKITLRAAPMLVPWLIRLLGATLRMTVSDPAGILQNCRRDPLLLAFWHNRLVMLPWLYREYFKSDLPCKVMISASRDGQLITDIIKPFGIGAVRGSSSRHAIRAMKEMARELAGGQLVLGLTPDGPRGPVYQVQPGIIHLAAHSGLPIVPVTYHLAWQWRTRSWDQMPVPLPFTRCELVIGEPLYVAADADFEAAAKELARRLGE